MLRNSCFCRLVRRKTAPPLTPALSPQAGRGGSRRPPESGAFAFRWSDGEAHDVEIVDYQSEVERPRLKPSSARYPQARVSGYDAPQPEPACACHWRPAEPHSFRRGRRAQGYGRASAGSSVFRRAISCGCKISLTCSRPSAALRGRLRRSSLSRLLQHEADPSAGLPGDSMGHR
jgi:hypothetical protein